MSLIPGHDYVTLLNWRCPKCRTFYGESTKIGRFFGKKLYCSQVCALEFYPEEVPNKVFSEPKEA